MKSFLLLLVFLISLSGAHAVTLQDVSIDNSKTVKVSNAADGNKDLMGVWGQISKDPPKSFAGFIQEYRTYGGGPVSSAFGIKPFQLLNGFTKAFSGLMLLIFTGASIIISLQKVANGTGDLNFMSLAGKFMIGFIILFAPDAVYASGRIIQTAGQTIAYKAMSAAEGSALYEAVQEADVGKLQAGTIETKAAAAAQSGVSGYIAAKPEKSIEAFNKNNKLGIKIDEIKDPQDAAELGDKASQAQAQFAAAVAADPDYQSTLQKLRTTYGQDMVDAWGDSKKQDSIAKKYLIDVTDAATSTGYKIYGVSKLDRLVNMASNVIPNWPAAFADWLSKFVSGLLIPLAMWILTKGAQVALELTLVVVVLTFPFLMLDATKAAFLGAVKTFFSIAIIPTVGITLLFLFECFMAWLSKMVMGGQPWWNMFASSATSLVFTIAFLVFWIIGVAIIVWKTPKITKSILEGSSVLGSLAGSLMTAAAGTALAGVGVAGLIAGNPALAKGAMDAAGALAGKGGDAGSAGGTGGNGGALPTSGGSGSTGGSSGGTGGSGSGGTSTPPIPAMAEKSNLNKENLSDNIAADSMEQKIAKNNATESSQSGNPAKAAVGKNIVDDQAKNAVKSAAAGSAAKSAPQTSRIAAAPSSGTTSTPQTGQQRSTQSGGVPNQSGNGETGDSGDVGQQIGSVQQPAKEAGQTQQAQKAAAQKKAPTAEARKAMLGSILKASAKSAVAVAALDPDVRPVVRAGLQTATAIDQIRKIYPSKLSPSPNAAIKQNLKISK